MQVANILKQNCLASAHNKLIEGFSESFLELLMLITLAYAVHSNVSVSITDEHSCAKPLIELASSHHYPSKF